MKKIISTLLFALFSSSLFAQPTHDEEISYVDSFTNDSLRSPIYIYDLKNGTVIDSVLPSQYGKCYTLVLIKKMEGDWVQIQSIRHAPCPSDSLMNEFDGKWLYKTDLFVGIGYDGLTTGITIFSSHSKKSEVTLLLYGYEKVKIIDTYKSWAKIKFVAESTTIVGWVHRFDQCAYRWTTCNWE